MSIPTFQLQELVEPDRPITYGIVKPGPDIPDGVPYVRVVDMKDGTVLSHQLRRTSHQLAASYRRSSLRVGDLLISIRGHVGRMAFVPEGLSGANITQDTARIAVGKRGFPEYIRWYLASPEAQRWMAARVKGVAVTGINLGDLRELPVPLPPLPEQKRIAAILDKADAIRRKRQQAIRLTEELLRSAFLDMFGDPVTNPKRWEVKKFGDVGELDRGRSRHRPRNDPRLLGGPHPLIQTGEVANADGVIRTHTQTYSDLGLAQSKMWPRGTLCITIAANIAQTAVLSFDACFPDSVVGFTPGAGVTTEYVQQWLGFLQPTLEAQAPQSAQKNINLRILRELDVPVPDKATQRRYAAFVAKARATTESVQRAHEAERALSASLTQHAFSRGL